MSVWRHGRRGISHQASRRQVLAGERGLKSISRVKVTGQTGDKPQGALPTSKRSGEWVWDDPDMITVKFSSDFSGSGDESGVEVQDSGTNE